MPDSSEVATPTSHPSPSAPTPANTLDFIRRPEELPQVAQRLRKAALDRLRLLFAQRGQHLTPEMWSSLEAVVNVLSAMAVGTCPQNVYVSPIDPGVGKTSAYVCFLQALAEEPELAGVGAICFTSRLREVKKLADEVGLSQERFSTLTSDEEINNLGTRETNSAQVLLTTQQRLVKAAEGRRLGELPSLYFRGGPRLVRIWDETMEPAEEVLLSNYALGLLSDALAAHGHAEFADRLISFQRELEQYPDRAIVAVPELPHEAGLRSARGFLGLYADRGASEKLAAERFTRLAGLKVVLRHQNKHRVLVSYREHLPSDLSPILVLDASARVKSTYDLWEKKRGGLVKLPAAQKDYSNLTVHHWKRGGAKWAYDDAARSAELLDGVARKINQHPHDRWLVVLHKLKGRDLGGELLGLVDEAARGNVEVITWGQHLATNEYREARRVVLLGTLFYGRSAYEGIARAALGCSVDDRITDDVLEDVGLGEHRHHILQAVCRGAVRRMSAGVCGKCDAYIVASVGSKIGGVFAAVFPGCTVEDWEPQDAKLLGKQLQAFNYIYTRLDEGAKYVDLPEVYKNLGMSKHNFRRTVRKHDGFKRKLAEAGIRETSIWDTDQTVFARAPEVFLDLPDELEPGPLSQADLQSAFPDLIKKDGA